MAAARHPSYIFKGCTTIARLLLILRPGQRHLSDKIAGFLVPVQSCVYIHPSNSHGDITLAGEVARDRPWSS